MVGELHGVTGQVEEHLAEPPRIAAEVARHVGRRGTDELQPRLMGPQGQQRGEVVEQSPQVEVERLQVHLAGLDLGEVEDVVEEGQQ